MNRSNATIMISEPEKKRTILYGAESVSLNLTIPPLLSRITVIVWKVKRSQNFCGTIRIGFLENHGAMRWGKFNGRNMN